jgi:hypothetical protein
MDVLNLLHDDIEDGGGDVKLNERACWIDRALRE